MADLTNQERARLASMLARRRAKLGLSGREVARRASVDVHTYNDIERGLKGSPSTSSITAIAGALELSTSDVFAVVNWLPADELPSFTPYLRAKYQDMPDQAISEMSSYLQYITRKYHPSNGPTENEDEV